MALARHVPVAHAALLPALALACGIAVGVWTGVPAPIALACLALALAVSITALAHHRPHVLVLAVAAGWMSAGMVLGAREEAAARDPPLRRLLATVGDSPVVLVGRLTQDASLSPAGVSLLLRVEHWTAHGESQRVDGGVALTVAGQPQAASLDQWRSGRTLRVPAWLREPARYRNAGVPDHRLVLARRGLVLVGTVKSASLVEVVAPGSWADETAAAIRARIRALVRASISTRSARAGAVVTAILIGDRAGLDPADERRLMDAGTYHVIAISGGNIAILAGCFWLACRIVRLPYRGGLMLTAGGLAMYAAVAGGGSSVVRATLMAVVYLGGRAIDQRSSAASTLAIAATVILCAAPLALLDAGFLLTFGATTAIVTIVPGLTRIVRAPVIARAAVAVCAASLAAEIALLPLGALLFQRVTFAGVLLNLLAIPLMSIVQVGGMVVLALQAVHPPLAGPLAWVPQLAADWLIESASLVGWMPWIAWRVPAPSGWVVVAYYAALVAWLTRAAWLPGLAPRQALARAAIVIVESASAAWVLTSPAWPRPQGVLRVSLIDVGQGDATVVGLPGGRDFLVDAGGLGGGARFDVGERVVAPALWALGARRLDALVVTHGDVDHVGGAAAVATMMPAREVWEGIAVRDDPELSVLAGAAADAGIPWRTVQAGDTLADRGVTVSVLHPPLADWERRRVRNNDSVVLEIRYGDVAIVLTGDAGIEAEPAIAARLSPARIRVLKVGHHGSVSSTSTAFLAALHPAVAVVSCGRQNRFGHPSPAVLRRLFAAGATVFRTDLHGEITLETDGRALTVRTFTGEEYTVRAPDDRTAPPAPASSRGLKGAVERALRATGSSQAPGRQKGEHEITKSHEIHERHRR